MGYKVAVLPGDGVGPEIVDQGVKVLRAAAQRFGLELELTHGLAGEVARRQTGLPLPPESLEMCHRADAVLFGAHGDPAGQDAYVPMDQRRFNLRGALGLTFNLRPVWALDPLVEAAWLNPSRVRGVDYVIVRHLAQSVQPRYNKRRLWKTPTGLRRAVNTIGALEERVTPHLHLCFRLARERRRKLALVVHDNVQETSQLWRQIGIELAPQYPDVEVRHLIPDNFAHLLLRTPADFDVIVIDNTLQAGMLNDQGGAVMGSLGMCPSGAFPLDLKRGLRGLFGMYEPIHGSVPHRAGKDQVNPIGTVLSVAMLFRFSLDLEEVARGIEAAVVRVVEQYRTYDIWREGRTLVGTSRMGDLIAEEVLRG